MLILQPEVEDRIRAAARILLFLDYDGTLAPFAGDPVQACLDAATRDVLARVSRQDEVVTTIISGRALADLERRVGLPEIIYAGNHGLEIRGWRLDFVEPVAASRSGQLAHLGARLVLALQSVAGVQVEDKGLTISVHHRRAHASDALLIEETVRETVAPLGRFFQVRRGKLGFDIVPRTHWHKGLAVRWISDQLAGVGSECVYFGDDQTDEDAFASLPEAITFKVGVGETRAQFRVEGPDDVRTFLQWLERARCS